MFQSFQPLAETVIPRADNERLPEAIAESVVAVNEVEERFVLAPRRILHAAIRIGRSFELVFECCVL